MTIVISSPDEAPYGVFHPASPVGLNDDEGYWPSVAQYLLAREVESAEDRRRIRDAANAESAEALVATMQRRPLDASARAAALREALWRSVERNFTRRARLIETGEREIEARLGDDAWLGVGNDGRGENQLGRALMAVRAIARRRAEDPRAMQCGHEETGEFRTVCEHRLLGGNFRRRFTGEGDAFEELCERCCEALPAPPPRRKICARCLRIHVIGTRLPDVGTPAFLQRASTLRFTHRRSDAVPEVIALAPVPGHRHRWLLLDCAGRLHRFDAEQLRVQPLGALDPAAVDLSAPLELEVAPGESLAIVAESWGRRGVVLDPSSGKVARSLLRDDYHPEHCRFPHAFVVFEGRLLFVHATAWNRLDVADPFTGELLTARPDEGPEAKARALDYFHAGLVASPDGTRLLDNGWIWHPYGQVRVFSVARWLRENRWESEDGPSVRALSGQDGFWDVPLAWIDAKTVAIWGGGDDVDEPRPIVSIFDVESGAELRRFQGPPEGLAVIPPYLVAFGEGRGTSVWDPQTGERLAQDDGFVPSGVHPDSGELLTLDSGGGLLVSTLSG